MRHSPDGWRGAIGGNELHGHSFILVPATSPDAIAVAPTDRNHACITADLERSVVQQSPTTFIVSGNFAVVDRPICSQFDRPLVVTDATIRVLSDDRRETLWTDELFRRPINAGHRRCEDFSRGRLIGLIIGKLPADALRGPFAPDVSQSRRDKAG